jgi:hypothetical protein
MQRNWWPNTYLDFVADPVIVVLGSHKLEMMEAERVWTGKLQAR